MTSSSNDGRQKMTQALLCANKQGIYHSIFLSVFNISLSIAAFLNVLILIALHKESSLHPPSKFLFRCLAVSDLCVGLISQPAFAAELLFEIYELQNLCYYTSLWGGVMGVVFSGVSLTTVTAISVDRLLALSLGLRYRHVVTLTRVRVTVSCFWFVSVAVSLMRHFWSFTIFSSVISITTILCLVTSAFCYIKIFFLLRHHQVQIQHHHGQQGQPNGGGIPLNMARYRKTVSAALWVQITLIACCLPLGLLMSVASLSSGSLVPRILGGRYTLSLVYLSSSLNPILYCWKIKEVRQAAKDTIRAFCCLSS